MRVEGDRARYIEFAKRTLIRNLSLDGLRIVVDCANGAAYKVAPEALWELGAEVISIGVEPDGFNINKGVGSTAPTALIKKVREVRADIGIALDGDADRVIIVDEAGKVVDGDQLMAAIAQSWKDDGRLSKPGIVATVMSNLGLERYLQGCGLSLATNRRRRPLCARTYARARFQPRWRAIRPYHPFGSLHDGRWSCRRLAAFGDRQAAGDNR